MRRKVLCALGIALYLAGGLAYAFWLSRLELEDTLVYALDPELTELVNESLSVARAFPGAPRKARRRRRSGPTSRRRNAARGDAGTPAVGRRFVHKLSARQILSHHTGGQGRRQGSKD